MTERKNSIRGIDTNYFATHQHALLRICSRVICVNAGANCSEEAKCLYDKQVEYNCKYL